MFFCKKKLFFKIIFYFLFENKLHLHKHMETRMKRILLGGMFLFLLGTISAQESNAPATDTTAVVKKEKPEKVKSGEPLKKMFFGMGFGLGMSRNGGSLNLAPMIGYNLHKRVQIGAKFTYWYTWHRLYDDNRVEHKVDDHMYALSAFTRIIIFKGLYFHAEPEYMNRGSYESNVWQGNAVSGYSLPAESRVDVFNMYVGGGFYKGLNNNSGMFVQLLWNLNQTTDSYYSNPYLQVGFTF